MPERFFPLLDDPQLERHMRRSLREQAGRDPDPVARDLAKDLLSGAVTLRQAADSRAYGELLSRQAQDGLDWWQSLSDEERAARMAESNAYMRGLTDEDEQESPWR